MVRMMLLLFLITAYNPEKQADAILSYVTVPKITMYGWRMTIDGEGYVWLIGDWDILHAVRINPNGKIVLDKIPLPKAYNLGWYVRTDRWNNAYYVYSKKEKYDNESISLARVSTDGLVHDYSPWPIDQAYDGNFIEITSNDTLIAVSRDFHSRDNRIAKAIINPEGITPTDQNVCSECEFLDFLRSANKYGVPMIDWGEGFGFYVGVIRDGARNKIHVFKLNLKPEDGYPAEKIGEFYWREYVWKTYNDTWIAEATYASHKDGGYSLCLPDPKNSSSVYVLRLGEDGIPIEPSNLNGGGERSVRSFNRLPKESKPYVDMKIWFKDYTLTPDSAMVVFWGCDEKGNLYTYRKIKKF
jgi:hypothetical protein